MTETADLVSCGRCKGRPAEVIKEQAAEIERLRCVLRDLLQDTQHAEHRCTDLDCPVRRAMGVLANNQPVVTHLDETLEMLDELARSAKLLEPHDKFGRVVTMIHTTPGRFRKLVTRLRDDITNER